MQQFLTEGVELDARIVFVILLSTAAKTGTDLHFDGYRRSHTWRSELNGTIFLISIGNGITFIDWCSEQLCTWSVF